MLQTFDDTDNAPLRHSDKPFSLADADVLGGLRKPTITFLEHMASMDLRYITVIPQVLAEDTAGALKMSSIDPVFGRQLHRHREGLVTKMEHIIVSTPRLLEVQDAFLSKPGVAAILEAAPHLRNRLLVAATAIEYRIRILGGGRIYIRLADLTPFPAGVFDPRKGEYIVQPSEP